MRQEVVIGGWRLSTASPREIGSILVGYYDGGKLRFAAGVGKGYTARMRRELLVMLQRLSRETSPFEFTEWSRHGRLRHPSFQGLREDKPGREVRAERPRW